MKYRASGQLVTPSQAAKMLGCHRSTVYRWIKQGKVPFVRTPSGYLLGWSLLTAVLRGRDYAA